MLFNFGSSVVAWRAHVHIIFFFQIIFSHTNPLGGVRRVLEIFIIIHRSSWAGFTRESFCVQNFFNIAINYRGKLLFGIFTPFQVFFSLSIQLNITQTKIVIVSTILMRLRTLRCGSCYWRRLIVNLSVEESEKERAQKNHNAWLMITTWIRGGGGRGSEIERERERVQKKGKHEIHEKILRRFTSA